MRQLSRDSRARPPRPTDGLQLPKNQGRCCPHVTTSLRERSNSSADGARPWISALPIAIGFAPAALDETHEHATVTEIFLVGRGAATTRVDDRSIDPTCGDVLVVEPGEARAILSASSDLRMFVVHVPGEDGVLRDDKTLVERDRLDL